MRPPGAVTLAVAASLAAVGCAPGDEVVPERPVDAAPDLTDAVEPDAAVPIDESQMAAARAVLLGVAQRAPTYLVDGRFPAGIEALTPQATCCAAGGVTLCVPSPAAWVGTPSAPSLWERIGLSIDVVHAHVYSASSNGDEMTIWALGDLDCDGTTAQFVLTCRVPDGVVVCVLEPPARVE